MSSENLIDTETLIASLGQVRRWVLPSGIMRELFRRGPDVLPALTVPIEKAIQSEDVGLGSRPIEAFFCFYLLGVDPNPSLRGLLDRICRCDTEQLDLITGSVTESTLRPLIAAILDPDDIDSHFEWIESLVSDPGVDMYAKLKAIESLLDLAAQDVLSKQRVLATIESALTDRSNEKQDELSSFLVCCLIDTCCADVVPIVEAAFARGQIDTMIVGTDSLAWLSDDEDWVKLQQRAEENQEALKDPVGFLSGWYAFSWEAAELRPEDMTYTRISSPSRYRETGSKKKISSALDSLETTSFDVCPKEAIAALDQHCAKIIPELTKRVRFGIDSARRDEPRTSYTPYVSALLLALNVDKESVLFDDSQLFLDILDLPTPDRHDWFGYTFDGHVVAALAHMLHGETKPIETRLLDERRDDISRANLIYYFPLAVYARCLSRERCLNVLHNLAEKWFQPDGEETSGLVLGAVREALCMMSVPNDTSVMEKANQLGVENGRIPNSVTERLVQYPSQAAKIIFDEVLPERNLEKALDKSDQFSDSAINPPPVDLKIEEESNQAPPIESGTTIRIDMPRVGRNDPCPCGSGKKSKKCCGRTSVRS